MSLRELSLLDWTRMSDEVARRECEALACTLPHSLKLSSLEEHSYCGRTHRIARFTRREAGDLVHFVLVPGGDVRLGFDGRDFRPKPWQTESYRDWPPEMIARGVEPRYVKWSINDFVDGETSPPRIVYLPSFLIEVEAREIARREDIELLSTGDPMFGRFRNEYPESGNAEHYGGVLGQNSYIVERDSDGTLRVWRRPPATIRYVEQQLAKSGMRLLTCDEWEHACGAGSRTLFRWGDDTPSDFHPDDTCAEDRELKRAWALSLGQLRYETPPPGWDLHDRPNLFGLRIAANPYRRDIVSDEPWALGGDGGCYICGGSGFFLSWLPLASAYRNYWRDTSFSPDETNVADDYHRVRRVIPLP